MRYQKVVIGVWLNCCEVFNGERKKKPRVAELLLTNKYDIAVLVVAKDAQNMQQTGK